LDNLDKLSNSPIGIFDSGVGGLTVAREIMRQLPQEKLVYFGDTARVPYGSKSQTTIIRYTRQIIRFLQSKNVKAIVVACNTASAFALEEVADEIDIPIIGVVKPGANIAAKTTKNNKIGVIGTAGTIDSKLYTKIIHQSNKKAQVLGKACPLFVPLVEEGWLNDPVTIEVAKRYLAPLMDSGIDTLIMGCTHYPLLRTTIQEIVGDGVQLINPAYETTKELYKLLNETNLIRNGNELMLGNQYEFYVSDAADKFMRFADSILPYDVDSTKLISIEEF
jgi:glutamate racemase